nr:7kDa-protein [Grapevine leafroll-associated virus 13]
MQQGRILLPRRLRERRGITSGVASYNNHSLFSCGIPQTYMWYDRFKFSSKVIPSKTLGDDGAF